jgi:CubicO group peptidase (beta-lactamase class C family)
MKNFLMVLFLICFFGQGFAQNKKQSKEWKLFQELVAKEHIPGLAYAVVKDGTVISQGTMGYASLPFKAKVTPATAFQLASCSKIYCSLLLGRLFDMGLLKPEQSIGDFIDSIPAAWKEITVLQLAAHQSGIQIADFSKAKSSADAVALAKSMPMQFTPGSQSAYVSSDYWILLHIIEKVTGQKYYDALKKYVLEPLHLKHTFVSNLEIGMVNSMDLIPEQAQEYHWFDEDSTMRISTMNFTAIDYAAGGVYSSIEDLAIVAQCFDKGSFISPATKKLISNGVLLKNGKPGSFGLGLVVNDNYEGHKLIEHSGGPALADFVRFDNERYTFIVLTNNRGTYPYLAKALATLYIPGLSFPKVPEDWK